MENETVDGISSISVPIVDTETKKRGGLPSYADLGTFEQFPKIEWHSKDEAHTFVMKCDRPREVKSKFGDGLFYVFDVEEDGTHKVIMTSAYTMAKGIKALEPYLNKRMTITRRIIGGKTSYEVNAA